MRSWPGPFHRRERLARFRALLAVATLLIALVPGPHANAQTGAVPLDLPAMSLRRTDLDELGLVGFEHRSSAAIWPQDYLETQAGADPELQVLLSSLLIDGGAVRRYSMVFERTDATGGVTSRIEPYLVQFAHPSGAKAWYDFKANESPSGNAADVPGVQAYGDASELTASSGPSSRPPGKYAQLDFTVSLGSIYAGVQYANFADVDQAVTAPGTAEIEALMDLLVARIERLMDVADPGLSNATLSFAGSGSWLDRLPPLIATYSHTYSFIDGAYQPFPGDTAMSIAKKERYYSSSGTVREFHQFSGFGTVNPVPPSVDIWITELASTDAAETRLAASLDLSPNYHDKVEITGYDDLGDGMVFFAYTYDVSSAVTLSGYRIDVRMGKVVFRLGVDAVTPFGPDVVYELASAQVECLRMGRCPGPYEFPIAAFSGG